MIMAKRTFLAPIGLLLALCMASGAALAEEQTWRINLKNADIREFVDQVAQITGKTFVVDPRLKGEVTVVSNIDMNAEAVYELFLSALRVHGFIAAPSGDLIRIQQNVSGKQSPGPEGALTEVAPEDLVTRVIAAQNVDSAELVKILRPLIPQYGHIAAVAKPNIVIISDHADNIGRLMGIVELIDVADEQELVVVPLKEAWVGTLVPLLEKVAPDQIGQNAVGPQRIRLIANERNNSLVIQGKPRPVAQMLKLIDRLDQPTTAANAVQVIYLKYADATKVAEVLKGVLMGLGGGGEAGTAAQVTVQPDESLNAIVVRANPRTMTEVRNILEQLDIRRTQVLIEAAVVEVQINDTRNVGVEMGAVDASGKTTPLITTSLNSVISSLLGRMTRTGTGTDDEITPDVLSGLASIGSPTLSVARIDPDGLSFGAIVTALATSRDAKLLSTPSILTLDNEEANIVVGNEVPFRGGSFTTTSDGVTNPFTTVDRKDVGLQLTITPHIHDGTSVRLEISQEITSLVESQIGPTGLADVLTSKRAIETTVLAEDQQIVVLGGLIQENLTDSGRKVPLLGDIPGLGRLFRSSSKTNLRTNLLIFMRPTVIKTLEDADEVTARKYRDIWEVEITSPVPDELDALFRGDHDYDHAPESD